MSSVRRDNGRLLVLRLSADGEENAMGGAAGVLIHLMKTEWFTGNSPYSIPPYS
jgi:hypothetical protein